ncbi:ornithine--oxo-acid transaminase [Ralstonia insidiosa]|uniref:ornithine aminotransferase n=1 Tax=Ralstonia insidiosa TaxID=190721 RepID=A0A191ZSF6_9RALS|nr:ornithine--oxo-acid transaminase [Ralstonia insidiosa]ANJ71034.1 ornithine--oxo-acid transaminase [Ralstonia insidiosa]KAB0471611.1 ornithine--oxo-acid transaminase [Ralstonia insidiosa]MBY4908839.1 ornithine--oxo-acid transaminase [Ralstonia insidiosa]
MTTALQHPSYALEAAYGARNYAPLPVMLERGEGVWLFDTAGRRYLDMMSAYSAVSFGHSHPKLVAALVEQAGRLTLTSRAFHNTELGPFLADVCRITRMDRALPMNTGAEAVETAIKAARKWARDVKGLSPDVAEIIVFENNFHGRTTTIVGFSSHDQYRYGFGPFAAGFRRIPFGDADALRAAIGPNTGAILMEPVQGEGGIVVPPPGYLKLARELATQHNVLLVCDEVQTGLGRTGDVLASWHEGVDADLVILGKALGGGMVPVSAIAGRESVIGVFQPGDHGSTFGGNPLAAHIGRAALALLIEEQLPQRAARLGDAFIAELKTLVGHGVRQVRGRGLMIGLQLDADIEAHDFVAALAEHGVLSKDTYGNVIRLTPPLVIGQAELELARDVIRRTLADWPRRKAA